LVLKGYFSISFCFILCNSTRNLDKIQAKSGDSHGCQIICRGKMRQGECSCIRGHWTRENLASIVCQNRATSTEKDRIKIIVFSKNKKRSFWLANNFERKGTKTRNREEKGRLIDLRHYFLKQTPSLKTQEYPTSWLQVA